jgi:hypothetical protein
VACEHAASWTCQLLLSKDLEQEEVSAWWQTEYHWQVLDVQAMMRANPLNRTGRCVHTFGDKLWGYWKPQHSKKLHVIQWLTKGPSVCTQARNLPNSALILASMLKTYQGSTLRSHRLYLEGPHPCKEEEDGTCCHHFFPGIEDGQGKYIAEDNHS